SFLQAIKNRRIWRFFIAGLVRGLSSRLTCVAGATQAPHSVEILSFMPGCVKIINRVIIQT
ncbi:hypothetical protein ACUVFN_005692, partial [Escherichia coli]